MTLDLVQKLVKFPPWREEDVGRPLPDSPYAVSVALPTWESVISYEREESRVINKLQSGYPRFKVPDYVSTLSKKLLDRRGTTDEICYLYPTRECAERALIFIEQRAEIIGEISEINGVWAVFVPKTAANEAKAYWQHAGEGISARHAEAILKKREQLYGTVYEEEIVARLSDNYKIDPDYISLFPSGMASIWTAVRFCTSRSSAGTVPVQFGFPYVDTLKLLEINQKPLFFPKGSNEDIELVKESAKQNQLNGLFCEAPSNPLLNTPNILKLSKILKESNIPFIVDDTLSACCNLNILPHCDMIVCSLTKYFSGIGDVMGGAAIINPASPFADELRRFMNDEGNASIYSEDMKVLAENSRGFKERVKKINENSLALAEFLEGYPSVEKVFYPGISKSPEYTQIMRKDGGYGGLLSFVLKNKDATPLVFNNIKCCKGPNLGMEYTLACPFTLLAHFAELDWAEECGLSRFLIRVSVGTEDKADLISRFQDALAADLL